MERLPTGYLRWLLTLEGLEPALRAAVRLVLLEREAATGQPSLPLPYRDLPAEETVQELISAGRRALAARAHPDAGGSHEAMVAINTAADWLETLVARAYQGVKKSA